MAQLIVLIAGVYLAFGLVFAIPYVLAIPGGLGFRMIIAPGVTTLWPLLIRRWPK